VKVILNKDLPTLGEEGDVKDVARGYARNYLFPRGIALPYTPKTMKLFEARKEEIEARKVQKRQDALGLKERLESLELEITMPAGANGRLYGAVTAQTLADELEQQGFQMERKRIELAGNGFKNAGKYKATVKLYESSSAEIQVTVISQIAKTETPHAQPARGGRHRREEAHGNQAAMPAGSLAADGVAEVSVKGQVVPAEAALPESIPSENADNKETAGGEPAGE
jgi:large subunit ribosomal protein L9